MKPHSITKPGLYLVKKLHKLDTRARYMEEDATKILVTYLTPSMLKEQNGVYVRSEYIGLSFPVILTDIYKVPFRSELGGITFLSFLQDVVPITQYQLLCIESRLYKAGNGYYIDPSYTADAFAAERRYHDA